jgi:hypothetical protein
MGHAIAARASQAPSLGAVRGWWKAQHPQPSLAHRLDVAYTSALTAAVVGALAYGTASSALSQVVTPNRVAGAGPAVAFMAVLLAAHWGMYQGPAVFTAPDVANLFAAPLSRRALVSRRLVRALLVAATAGAAAAALLLVGVAGRDRGVEPLDAAGTVIGCAELGVFAACSAWTVQRSARWAHVVRRLTWPAVLAASLVTALGLTGSAGRGIAAWSGPWGWAVQASTGRPRLGWSLALGGRGLTWITAAAVRSTLRSAGDCSTERHMRRAEGRAGAIAGVTSFDARSARKSLGTAAPASIRGGAADLPRLRRAISGRAARKYRGSLAIVRRSALATRRTPGRALESVALAAAGTWLWLVNVDRPLVVSASLLLVYAAAARMLAPLRAELDLRTRARVLLRPRLGIVLRAHVVVPALVISGAAVVAVAGAALADVLPAHGPALAIVAIAAIPAITCCAAMSARRGGRLPHSVLAAAMFGDPSGGAIALAAWLTSWPVLGVIVAGVPVALVGGHGRSGGAVAALWIALPTVALVRLVGTDPPVDS